MGSLAEGIAERAKMEGEKQGQKNTLKALKMLRDNAPMEKICRETGCTIAYLNKLRTFLP